MAMTNTPKKNTIYNENCLDTMARMPDGFVDLTITSPPYDNIRSYKNGVGDSWNFEKFMPIADELYRVTKDGGVVVWVVGDATIKGSETGTSFKQALWAKECGFNLHDTMIYRKKNYIPLTHNRYEQEFEYMFVFSKGKPKTWNPILVPCKHAGKTNTGNLRNNGSDVLAKKHGHGKKYKKYKIKGNIWEYPVGVEKDRDLTKKVPAIFPEQLAVDHIVSWTNKFDVVYDPFMGSGTTAVAAVKNKRYYIGSEIAKEYWDVAQERLNRLFRQY